MASGHEVLSQSQFPDTESTEVGLKTLPGGGLAERIQQGAEWKSSIS